MCVCGISPGACVTAAPRHSPAGRMPALSGRGTWRDGPTRCICLAPSSGLLEGWGFTVLTKRSVVGALPWRSADITTWPSVASSVPTGRRYGNDNRTTVTHQGWGSQTRADGLRLISAPPSASPGGSWDAGNDPRWGLGWGPKPSNGQMRPAEPLTDGVTGMPAPAGGEETSQ